MTKPHLKIYLNYIALTGGVTDAQFDDDWSPIGPIVRAELEAQKFVVKDMTDQKLMLTPEGEAARGQ